MLWGRKRHITFSCYFYLFNWTCEILNQTKPSFSNKKLPLKKYWCSPENLKKKKPFIFFLQINLVGISKNFLSTETLETALHLRNLSILLSCGGWVGGSTTQLLWFPIFKNSLCSENNTNWKKRDSLPLSKKPLVVGAGKEKEFNEPFVTH